MGREATFHVGTMATMWVADQYTEMTEASVTKLGEIACHEGDQVDEDGCPAGVWGETQALYAVEGGKLAVHVQRRTTWDAPAVDGLSEVADEDLQEGGRFADLGAAVGFEPGKFRRARETSDGAATPAEPREPRSVVILGAVAPKT